MNTTNTTKETLYQEHRKILEFVQLCQKKLYELEDKYGYELGEDMFGSHYIGVYDIEELLDNCLFGITSKNNCKKEPDVIIHGNGSFSGFLYINFHAKYLEYTYEQIDELVKQHYLTELKKYVEKSEREISNYESDKDKLSKIIKELEHNGTTK